MVYGRKTAEYKVVQINLGRANTATHEIREKAVHNNVDVLMIQEPYIWRGRATGWGQSITVMGQSDCNNENNAAGRSENPGAALVVINPSLAVLKVTQFCSTNCVCVEITGPLGVMYMITVYCKFSHDIDRYIQQLRKTLDKIGKKKVLICMDSNARSTTWFSSDVDARGMALEELIAEYDLTVLNKAGSPHTFAAANGKSNIDVTLATRSLVPQIQHWKVYKKWTTSDHRAIEIKIASNSRELPMVKSRRFATHKADWERFDGLIYAGCDELRNYCDVQASPENTELLAQKITKLIIDVCEATMPRKKRTAKSNPWWTPELTKKKKELYKLRRSRQRACRAEDPAIAENQRRAIQAEIKAKLRCYKKDIREAKKTSWERFVTKEGCNNPWGITYRLAVKKYTPDRALSSIRLANNDGTLSWEDTATTLLGSLVPDDDNNDNESQTDIRVEGLIAPDTMNAPEFTYGDVRQAVMSLNDNRAPGLDEIEVLVFKRAAKILCEELVVLYNGCLKCSVFPKIWKIGSICVLLKGPEKDATNPKAYRPICLLSVMGKTLEKLMSSRLRTTLYHEELSSKSQFGFKSNSSTEDALQRLRELVAQGNEKYTLALLFDISGAFDNVWWPDIFVALKRRNCPKNIYWLMRNYFEDRTVKIVGNYKEAEKRVSKGCPQGSVLGPSCWNLIFDDLLIMLENRGIETIAYADDLLVVIHGRSRKDLENAGQETASMVENWCKLHKLELSRKKSEMILFKGSLDIARPPRIKIDNGQIPMKKVVRYLEVWYKNKMNIAVHVKKICEKCMTVFNAFKSIARKTWGLKHKELRILYKGIFLSVVTYAAIGWEDKLLKGTTAQLQRAQRYALVTVTKAYRTTSTDGLLVSAGEPPIDLMIKERSHRYRVRRRIPFTFGNLTYDPNNENNEIKRNLEKEVLRQWQDRWDNSTKGRETYAYLPNVENRMKKKWLRLDHHIMQFIGGHGDFQAKLHSLGLTESPRCECGSMETPSHLIYDCRLYQEERTKLKEAVIGAGIAWPPRRQRFVERALFDAFKTFAFEVLRAKEQLNEQ